MFLHWVAIALASFASVLYTHPDSLRPASDRSAVILNPQSSEPPAIAPDDYETVEELLDALERAGQGVARMSAEVTFIKTFAIAGDQEVRQGDLHYEQAEGTKRFAVRFDKFINGTRVEDDPREYIFDGEWFVEKFIAQRDFIKRQIVPPGEVWDPMKLGEGPFPVPVGQRKDEVLRDWQPALAESTEGVEHPRLVELARPLQQLLLVPRAENADDADYAEVRVWYDRTDLLPRMLKATNFAGDETTVVLRDVRINDAASATPISTEPPPQGSGWHVTIEPWQGQGATRVDTTVEVGR